MNKKEPLQKSEKALFLQLIKLYKSVIGLNLGTNNFMIAQAIR